MMGVDTSKLMTEFGKIMGDQERQIEKLEAADAEHAQVFGEQVQLRIKAEQERDARSALLRKISEGSVRCTTLHGADCDPWYQAKIEESVMLAARKAIKAKGSVEWDHPSKLRELLQNIVDAHEGLDVASILADEIVTADTWLRVNLEQRQ